MAENKKTEVKEEVKEEVKTEEKKPDLVPFRAFKDNDKYKDDIFVQINGHAYQIKRGETVMLPRNVVEVLEQSAEQDTKTARLIEKESNRFRRDSEIYR